MSKSTCWRVKLQRSVFWRIHSNQLMKWGWKQPGSHAHVPHLILINVIAKEQFISDERKFHWKKYEMTFMLWYISLHVLYYIYTKCKRIKVTWKLISWFLFPNCHPKYALTHTTVFFRMWHIPCVLCIAENGIY